MFNGYWIYRSFSEKSDIKEIVDNKIDPIIDKTNEKNNNINKNNDKFNDKLKDDIKKESDKVTGSNKFETIVIDDKTYQIELENDLEESQKQTKYYINKVNEINDHYNNIINEKEEIIKELTNELNDLKKDLTSDITKHNINKELKSFRKDFFRFGIDLYANYGIPISDWIENKQINTNFTSYSFGIGLNVMVMKRINVRVNSGIYSRDSVVNPEMGLAIGWYF